MIRKRENTLYNIRGRWKENNKWLTWRDLIFVYSAYGKDYVLSKETGELYYYSQIIYS